MSATLLKPPSVPPDDMLYEVIDGNYVEKPVGANSTWLAFELATWLKEYCRLHNLGLAIAEMVFILDSVHNLRRRPDVAFVSAEKWPLGQPLPLIGDWAIIPDLAVEVLSPNDDAVRVLKKVDEYFHYGVKEVWMAVPDARLVYVYTDATGARILRADDGLASALLPGWSIKVGDWLPMIAETNGTQSPPSA